MRGGIERRVTVELFRELAPVMASTMSEEDIAQTLDLLYGLAETLMIDLAAGRGLQSLDGRRRSG
ncbi:MAG: hypothetical protein AAGN66_08720 [Acidobacteriota bacterium]